MATRNVFYNDNNNLKMVPTSFKWGGHGFSFPVKQQSAVNLLNSFRQNHANVNPIDISSASQDPIGRDASAMRLTAKMTNGRKYSVEQLFQSGKVFQNHGQLKSIINDRPLDAKRAAGHINRSDKLVGFNAFGIKFPLTPRTAFYDWLYLNALMQHPKLMRQLLKHNAFTDIQAGKNTINSQAKSCALFTNLYNKYGLKGITNLLNNPKLFTNMEKHLDATINTPQGKQNQVQSQQGDRTKTVLLQEFKILAPKASRSQVLRAIKEANATHFLPVNKTVENVAYHLYNDGFYNFGNKAKSMTYRNVINEITGKSKSATSRLRASLMRLEEAYDKQDLVQNNGLVGFDKIVKQLKPFTSESNLQQLKMVMGKSKYPKDVVDKSIKVLRHLYDTGTDFDLKPDVHVVSRGGRHKVIRLNAVLSDTHNQVRLLNDNALYVGSVITRQGELAPFKSAKPTNPYELIDYAAGNIKGTVVQNYAQEPKSGFNHHYTATLFIKDPSSKKIDRFGFKQAHSNQFSTRAGLLNGVIKQYGGPKAYVESRIILANQIYLRNMLGESYEGVDDQISSDQTKLNKFAEDNGISDADKALAEKAAVSAVNDNKSLKDHDAVSFEGHPKAKQLFDEAQALADKRSGTFENGFDPNIVINMLERDNDYNPTNALIVSLNALNYDPKKLTNEQEDPNSLVQMRDHLIHFDPNNIQYRATSKPKNIEGLFKIRVLQHVKRVLTSDLVNSANPNPQVKVAMDQNGILRWQGKRTASQYKSSTATNQLVSGEIGQIFAPSFPKELIQYAAKHHISNNRLLNMGIISTNFRSGKNFNIVPGVKGWFQFKGVDKGLPRMARLRGRNAKDMLYARINEDLDAQLSRVGSGDLTSPRDDSIINGLYHSELIGKRLPDHWFEHSQKSVPVRIAQIETWRGRVSFGKRLGEISQDVNRSQAKDNPFAKVIGNKPMSELTNDYRGTFDPDLTSGGKKQGLVLYLDKNARLSPATTSDGTRRILPIPKETLKAMAKEAGVDPEVYTAQSPIAYIPELKFIKYMPEDRKMVAKKYALNESSSFDLNSRAAYMSFGGDNFEDSVLVSKPFAEKHKVPSRDAYGNIQHNKDGSIKMRPLMTGDKLDDFSHNKATISFVIDPNMSPDEAKNRMLSKEVAIFKQNPGLDVVMDAPSPITRGNGSIAREAMENHSKNVKPVIYKDANGTVHKLGESSLINFMNTIMTGDKNTTNYDKHNVALGKMRKLSSQMGWGLISQKYTDPATGKVHHCGYNILRHEFGKKAVKALSDYREYQLTEGIDIDMDGRPHTMHRTYWKDGKLVESSNPNAHPSEHRQMFVAKPSDSFMKQHPSYKAPKSYRDFLRMLGNHGGTLLLPFNVKMFGSTKGHSIISNEVPIMSAKLRHNTQMNNGQLKINDYNGLYAYDRNSNGHHKGLFINAQMYRTAQDKYNQAKEQNDHQSMHRYKKVMNASKSAAQDNVTLLGRKVRDDQLGGPTGKSIYNKSGMIRTKLMAVRVGHSSTAVSQNDPRMPLDTIAVSPRVYRTIFGDSKSAKLASVDNSKRPSYEKVPSNMKVDPRYKNTYVMLHRDPVNHSGSERGFKVVEDPDAGDGFRMNAINDNSFEGDNDGDTYGVINVSARDPKVQSDLKHMSVPYQLTDNSGGTLDKDGNYRPAPKTYLDVSADVISGGVKSGIAHQRKDANDPYKPKQVIANKFAKVATEKVYSTNSNGKKVVNGPKTIQKRLKDTTHLVHTCMRNNFGACHLDFSSPKALHKSIYQMVVKQGAKGSVKAMDTFMDHVHGNATMVREFVDNATKNKVTYGDSKATKIGRLDTKLNDIAREPKSGLRHSKTLDLVKQAYLGKNHGIDSKDPKVNKKIHTTAKVLDYTIDHYKGYPKLMSAFNREGLHHQDIVSFDTLAAKSFHTAAAGSISQKMVSSIGNRDMNTAMDLSQPGDQINLQIKHHPEWLKPIDKLLNPLDGEYTNLLNGRFPDNGKMKMRPKDVLPEWEHTFSKYGVTLNPKEIDSLKKIQCDGTNKVKPLSQIRAEHGTLINKVAYTGNQNNPGGQGAVQKAVYHNDYAQKHNLPQESLYSGPYLNIAPKPVRESIEHPIILNKYENAKYVNTHDKQEADRIKKNPRITKIRNDFKNMDTAKADKHYLIDALNKNGKGSSLDNYYRQLAAKRDKAHSVAVQHTLQEAANNKLVNSEELANAQRAQSEYKRALSAKQSNQANQATQEVFKAMDKGRQSVNDINEIMSANDHDLEVHNPKYYKAHSHTMVINGQKKTFSPTADHDVDDDRDLSNYYHKLYTLRDKAQQTSPKHIRDCMIAHDTTVDSNSYLKDALKKTASHNKNVSLNKPDQKSLAAKSLAETMQSSDRQAKEQQETAGADKKPEASQASVASKSAQPSEQSASSSSVSIPGSAKSISNEIDLTKGMNEREDTGIHKGGLESHAKDFSNSMNNQSAFDESLRKAAGQSNSQKSAESEKSKDNEASQQKNSNPIPKRPRGPQDSDDGFGL